FTKGQPTERIWYYDLSDIKVGKKTPFTLDRFTEFFRLLPERADSERSWTVTRQKIEAKNYDLKAVNPHAKNAEDTRTPEELLDLIEAKEREVAEALAFLRTGKKENRSHHAMASATTTENFERRFTFLALGSIHGVGYWTLRNLYANGTLWKIWDLDQNELRKQLTQAGGKAPGEVARTC